MSEHGRKQLALLPTAGRRSLRAARHAQSWKSALIPIGDGIPIGALVPVKPGPHARKDTPTYGGITTNKILGRCHNLIAPDGSCTTVDDHSLWNLYEVPQWYRKPERLTESQPGQKTLALPKEGRRMSLPRFEIETKVPVGTILVPRTDTSHKGDSRCVYKGAVRLPDGSWRYSIQRELPPAQDSATTRWGSICLISNNALVTGYDLRPFGWVPPAERPKAAKPAPVPGSPKEVAALMGVVGTMGNEIRSINERLDGARNSVTAITQEWGKLRRDIDALDAKVATLINAVAEIKPPRRKKGR